MRDRLLLPVSTWPRICHGQARRATASLLSQGYEPYDGRLCCLAWSLDAALTSADGRQAFIPGLRRLPRLNPSRRVSCTNLVAESLAVRTQIPSWDGLTVSSLALPYGRMHNMQASTLGSI